MAAGLPIACANCGTMAEVVGEPGVYFDPEPPASIVRALKSFTDDSALSADPAQHAWQRAKAYSWNRCVNETFKFIAQVARRNPGVN